jgi:hypothetical protein
MGEEKEVMRRLNAFTTQKDCLDFKDEDELRLLQNSVGDYSGIHCKIHHLSNEEIVLFYKTTMYHLNRDKTRKYELRFNQIPGQRIREPICVKRRDETILFLDFTDQKLCANNTSIRYESKLMIYDPKTNSSSLFAETDVFTPQILVKMDITILELENGNILVENEKHTLYCWHKNGNLLFSFKIQPTVCSKEKQLTVQTSGLHLKEIESNKILRVERVCHYSIIDLNTLQKSDHEVKLLEETLLFKELEFDQSSRIHFVCEQFVILDKQTFWVGTKKGYYFIYDLKQQKILREISLVPGGFHHMIRPNLLIYLSWQPIGINSARATAMRSKTGFINPRSGAIWDNNIHQSSKTILYADERLVITLDFRNCLLFHKIHFRFVFFSPNPTKFYSLFISSFFSNTATPIW